MTEHEVVVLDASALLALLGDEPGADAVIDVLPRAIINTVNLAETVGRLADHGMPEPSIREAIQSLGLDVRPFDEEAAWIAGGLRPKTRSAGLSLGDRACLAMAKSLGLPVLTADRAWADVDAGIDVRLIR
jgi:PIN domain nuclease of toxin-antitoxin system